MKYIFASGDTSSLRDAVGDDRRYWFMPPAHDYYVDNSYTEYGWGKRRMLLTAAERWAGEPDLVRWCRRMARAHA